MNAEQVIELGEQIAETAALIDAATHRFLAQLRTFDEERGWQVTGAQSTAHWLSWRVGMDLGAARERVRVAKALGGLPRIDDALKGGEISYSKVRAITRVAKPENEEMLLTYARNTTGSQMEKICRMTRGAQKSEAKKARKQEDRRYVLSHPTDDGMVSIQVRLHPDEAARVLKAFQAAADGGNLADEGPNELVFEFRLKETERR